MKHALTISLVVLLSACGGEPADPDGGHVGPGAACTEIIEHCHTVDLGNGPAAECHRVGHDGPAELCETRLADCIAICDAVETDGGPPDSCDTIGQTCHPYDTGSGPAHDCHEVGHAGDVAACDAALAGCMATCSGDAGSHAHDEDGGVHD